METVLIIDLPFSSKKIHRINLWLPVKDILTQQQQQ